MWTRPTSSTCREIQRFACFFAWLPERFESHVWSSPPTFSNRFPYVTVRRRAPMYHLPDPDTMTPAARRAEVAATLATSFLRPRLGPCSPGGRGQGGHCARSGRGLSSTGREAGLAGLLPHPPRRYHSHSQTYRRLLRHRLLTSGATHRQEGTALSNTRRTLRSPVHSRG